MKKSIVLVSAGFLAVVFMLSACKSAPKPVDEPKPAETPAAETVPAEPVKQGKPIDETLTALRDRAGELSSETKKYGIDTFMPDRWNDAESARKAGLDSYGIDYDTSKSAFENAIVLFESLIQDAFNQIAAELEALIVQARADAVAAGAPEYFPDQFALADESAESARSEKNDGDLSGSYDTAQIALMRYRTLINGMKALALKDSVDRNDFAQYAPEEYDQAHAEFDKATAAYGTADAVAYEASIEMLRLAYIVNNQGFKQWSFEEKTKADEIRALCDSIKAAKASKEAYARAQSAYTKAVAYGEANTWELAYFAYTDSVTQFASVYQEVTLKRNAADLAITAAKARQQESTGLAQQADELAPLPENAEGFSDEEYILDENVPVEETK